VTSNVYFMLLLFLFLFRCRNVLSDIVNEIIRVTHKIVIRLLKVKYSHKSVVAIITAVVVAYLCVISTVSLLGSP